MRRIKGEASVCVEDDQGGSRPTRELNLRRVRVIGLLRGERGLAMQALWVVMRALRGRLRNGGELAGVACHGSISKNKREDV